MEETKIEMQENVPDDDFPTDLAYTTAKDIYGDFSKTGMIYEKIVRLMEEVGSIPKDKVNEFQHYKYVSASATLEKIQAGLIKVGLCPSERMTVERVDEIDTKDRKLLNYVVKCTLVVTDPNSGEYIVSSAFGSGMDTGDKGIMKAQTAARKYAWWGLLVVGTPDDPEADTATDAITSAPISQPAKTQSGLNKTLAKVLSVNREADHKPFVIETSEGTFKTFDKNVAISAELARSTGLEMELTWRPNPNPRYNDRILVADKKKEENG